MKFLAVSRRDGSIHILDIQDVIALKKRGKAIEYYTETEVFEHITSLESLVSFLQGYGYERLDRDNIVNMNKISRFDEETNKVIFYSAAGDELAFTVSWANLHKVKERLQGLIKKRD